MYSGKSIAPGIGGSDSYGITSSVEVIGIFPQKRMYLNIADNLSSITLKFYQSSTYDLNNLEYTYYCIIDNSSNSIRTNINFDGTAQIN